MSPSPTSTFSPTNLGPLTTIFTPPAAACSTLNLSPAADGVGVIIAWGQTCTTTTISSASASAVSGVVEGNTLCYPPKALSTYPNGTLQIYSPGLECPRGFTEACSVVKASRPAASVSGSSSSLGPYNRVGIWEVLGPGETGVKCCPSPFRCVSGFDEEEFCGLPVATAAGSLTGTYYTDACSVVSTTTTWESGATRSGSAQAVILVRGSTQPTGTAASGSNSESRPSSRTSSSGGLSLGVKIAIAVTIPVVVILILLGACVAYKRRRRRRERIRRSFENRSTKHPTTASAAPHQHNETKVIEKPEALAPAAASRRSRELDSPTAAKRSSSQPGGFSTPPLPPSPKKTSDTYRSQYFSSPERKRPERAYASPSDASTLNDRFSRGGPQSGYRSERVSGRTSSSSNPSPRTAHLVSSRTLEQLRAEHARLEAEMSRQGRLERLRSERDLLQKRIEEMEEEPPLPS